ncbi:MAG: primase-helicase zinc-binding domain-containing protein [Aeromonas sp.]
MATSIQIISSAAQYKWRETIEMAGIALPATAKKHGPCPICGGKDRFRFDDKDGRGTWFCNQCGAGDGLSLVQKATGKSMRNVLSFLASILGISGSAPLDRAAIERNLKRAEQRGKERKAKEASQREAAAALANLMADEAVIIDAAEHPYLANKGYAGFPVFKLARAYQLEQCSYSSHSLLHAIRDEQGDIISAELVDGQGRKTALVGGSKAGAVLIEPLADPDAETILFVCEGVATGYAVRELLGGNALGFAGLSKNGLLRAAHMAARYAEGRKVIICGDIGAEREADAAAAVIGVLVSYPPKGGDWDDYRAEVAA